MLSLTYIYAHLEPDSDEIRYIGKSYDPWGRLADHINEARSERGHQANWLNLLAVKGLQPRLELIAEVPVEEWQFWERHYIKYFRDLGFRLTNATPGGEGTPRGTKFSEETRRKMSVARTGKKLSPAQCLAISIRVTGRKLSSETRAKIRAAASGRKASPIALSNMRAAQIGRKHSLETRAKIRAASIGHSCSFETREKIRAAAKGRKASPETRAALSKARSGAGNHQLGKTGSLSLSFGRKNTLGTLEKMRSAQQLRRQKERENV